MIFFINTYSDGIYAAQEGRTAIITRNMLRSGDYFNMNVPGGVDYEKPIAHYWLCLPSCKIADLGNTQIHQWTEFALRFPSIIAALITIFVAGLMSWRIYGERAAFWSVVILSTMPNFVKLGRLAHIDMPLACSYTLAMWMMYLGYFEQRKPTRYLYWFYVFLALGVLLKGPLVIVLCGISFVVLMVVYRDWGIWKRFKIIPGLAIFLLISAPWYIYEISNSHGEFAQEFLLNQNLRRFSGIGSTYRNGERMPLFYYLPKLIAGALPWSIVGIAMVIVFAKRLWRRHFSNGTVFLLTWLISGLVFFSLSALKRGDYLLPLYPALAMLLGYGMCWLCECSFNFKRIPGLAVMAISGLLLILFALNCSGLIRKFGEMIVDDRINVFARRDGMSMIMISDFFNQNIVLSLIMVLLVIAVLGYISKLLSQNKLSEIFLLMTVVVYLGFLVYHGIVEKETDKFKTVKSVAMEAHKLILPHEKVLVYADFNTEAIFFMDRNYDIDGNYHDFDYVLTDEDGCNELMNQKFVDLEEKLRTIPDHQYPMVLLKVNKTTCGLNP